MFAQLLPNLLIGLREGLEASLVVSILIAYLVKSGRRQQLRPIWVGTGIAVGLSMAAGALLEFTAHSLSFKAQEGFGGTMSIIAVVFVTGMIFWMRNQARNMKGELQGRVESALAGGAVGLAICALLAVGREGLETALFVWAAVQATGSGWTPVAGAVLGLLLSVGLAFLIYRRSVSLNLATFFKVTGAALIVVVAGILAYGLHDLQEAGLLPGVHSLAFDVSGVPHLGASSVLGTILKGIFNFSPEYTWLQLVAYLAYLVPVMVLFFRPHRDSTITPATAPVAQPREVPLPR